MLMRTILALALAAGGLGQTEQDARALLQGVANASRALISARVEGRIDQDLDIGFGGGKRTLQFRVATREPRQARVEISGGEEWLTGLPYLAVCRDGGGWLYFDKVKSYEHLNAEDAVGYCTAGMLTDFSRVADDVTSAAVIGQSRAQFEGRVLMCTEVEAHYRVINDVMVPPGLVLKLGRVTRRMCIDRARHLILRDRFEADTDAGPDRYHIVQTVREQREFLMSDADLVTHALPRRSGRHYAVRLDYSGSADPPRCRTLLRSAVPTERPCRLQRTTEPARRA